MKKILIFGYDMNMGGAEKVLSDTLNYLKDYCEIDLYLLSPEGVLIKNIPKEVKIYKLKKNVFQYILFRFIPLYRKMVINKIANKKDYYAALGYLEGRSGTWVADIKKKIKKYAWIHTDVSTFDIGISDKEAKKTYSNVDKIICVSNESKKKFCKKFNISEEKVDVIYNYINETEIIKKANKKSIKNDVFTFVNVGSIRRPKRQDRLIYAAKYLKELGYNFKIQIIGTGPDLKPFKEVIKKLEVEDKVEMMGLKQNPYPYVKAADFFVLSSETEGYSLVIKEALLLKTKILSTDIVGPSEILNNGEFGILVPNDDDSIKYKMREILDNKDNFKELENKLLKYKGDNETIKKQTLSLLDIKY